MLDDLPKRHDVESAGVPGRRAATIYDVAKLAGVSHQLVSRYLKGEGIRPANRERVIAALAQLDYRPNLTARTLAGGRSQRIAVLTHEIGQVGPAMTAQGASVEARENGYILDILTLDTNDRAAIESAISDLNQQELAGVLALASTDEMFETLSSFLFHVPVVVQYEHDDAQGGEPSVLNSTGMDELIAYLVGEGHSKFFHVAGPRTWVPARNRERAYEMALEKNGLVSLGTALGDWSAASGFAAASEVPDDATAVIVSNDQMAIGVIRGLKQLGRVVPDDVSVTGVDDISEAAYITPPLTTLKLDFIEQGREAFRMLLRKLTDDPEATRPQTVELIIRESTGRVTS